MGPNTRQTTAHPIIPLGPSFGGDGLGVISIMHTARNVAPRPQSIQVEKSILFSLVYQWPVSMKRSMITTTIAMTVII
jgi:hypothetical protein